MDIFEDYRWHSSMEPTAGISCKKIIRRLPARSVFLDRFIRISGDGPFLIHRGTRLLWKFSGDRRFIEPVFKDDVLTEDSL